MTAATADLFRQRLDAGLAEAILESDALEATENGRQSKCAGLVALSAYDPKRTFGNSAGLSQPRSTP